MLIYQMGNVNNTTRWILSIIQLEQKDTNNCTRVNCPPWLSLSLQRHFMIINVYCMHLNYKHLFTNLINMSNCSARSSGILSLNVHMFLSSMNRNDCIYIPTFLLHVVIKARIISWPCRQHVRVYMCIIGRCLLYSSAAYGEGSWSSRHWYRKADSWVIVRLDSSCNIFPLSRAIQQLSDIVSPYHVNSDVCQLNTTCPL